MSGLAVLLAQTGAEVSGCDAFDTPRLRSLARHGVKVCAGHSPDHLAGVDFAVATPAVPADAPELAAARAAGIPVQSRGETLAAFFNARRGVAVFGTHGKTTTTVFAVRLLRALGMDPGWCAGGEAGGLPDSAQAPAPGRLFVAEADESDGTLALYRPEISVFTSADVDHLEHFSSMESYWDCFRAVLRATRGRTVACRDHAKAHALAAEASAAPVLSYGFSADADVRAENAETGPDGSRFDICEGAERVRVRTGVPGRHNILNALAAFAAARAAGAGFAEAAAALPQACGSLPARRFETVGEAGGVSVRADYAHHPAELRCAVEMAKLEKPRRLRVLFQPHRYTRTKALRDEFPAAFEGVDELVILPVYAAFEKRIRGGTSADLYAACRKAGLPAKLARSAREAWRHVRLTARDGDFVLLAGAGDIIALADNAREFLASLPPGVPLEPPELAPLAGLTCYGCGGVTAGGVTRPGPGEDPEPGATPVGAGSNMWFSDLATDERFAKICGPAEATIDGTRVSAPACMAGSALLAAAEKAGLSGLEALDGIPGTVGGWTAMNAGAHGMSVSGAVECVRALQSDGKEAILPASDCGFGYRCCAAAGRGMAFTEVVFRLERSTPAAVAARRRAFREMRKVRPAGLRTAGCVFKNPPGDSAGRLMDAAGVKGLSAGGARVWENHANVFVAGDGCTGSDLLALALMARDAVEESAGVRLEPEVRGFGEMD